MPAKKPAFSFKEAKNLAWPIASAHGFGFAANETAGKISFLRPSKESIRQEVVAILSIAKNGARTARAAHPDAEKFVATLKEALARQKKEAAR